MTPPDDASPAAVLRAAEFLLENAHSMDWPNKVLLVARAAIRSGEALAILEAQEWVQYHGKWMVCLACCHMQHEGHYKGCWIARALDALRATPAAREGRG